MISLEQRVLEYLLPAIKGRDVVDFGCGTGRWLSTLAGRSARSLTGIDCSQEMLAVARRKLSGVATLLSGDCDAPPLESRSADLILCSFVLSYLSSVANFAAHLRRIARCDADIFITDLHPETELRLGWRRGFRDGGDRVQLETHWRSLESVLADLARHGIRPVAVCEVPFGKPEFEILARAGKSALIPELRDQPAIYILELKAGKISAGSKQAAKSKGSVDIISGGRLAFAPDQSVPGEIRFEDGRIASLCSDPSRLPARAADAHRIDLSGFLVLPGLVNAHDHLEFALFPRLGRGGYQNFSEWANDIHRPDESPVREHRAVPKSTRLWWGAIRNLLCGVTTACHHNPYAAEVFEAGFPVRVVRDFGWAHSLEIDADTARKHADTPSEQPFIIHLGEGVDHSSAQQLFELDRMGALTDRTVVVHGLALNDEALSLLKSRGAALVWCPTSNEFLFGRTHEPRTVRSFSKVALGSDSSLTAQGDFLDEVRFAYEGIGLSAKELYEQVTLRAADVLRLVSGEGSLRVGGFADLMAIREKSRTPAEALVRSTFHDVELVIVGGRLQLASPAMKARLSSELVDGLEPLKIRGVVRWIRAPLAHLFADARSALGYEIRMNGRLLEHGA
jgi:cytosine/adenosine deaminase-related metal-dependent hydrolase/ubiquinone/menaquinone biosynthesis C-methylase UbiE